MRSIIADDAGIAAERPEQVTAAITDYHASGKPSADPATHSQSPPVSISIRSPLIKSWMTSHKLQLGGPARLGRRSNQNFDFQPTDRISRPLDGVSDDRCKWPSERGRGRGKKKAHVTR